MYDDKATAYMLPLFDYGAGATRVDVIVGPKGKKGKLVDYGVQSVQETFAATTPATISVGKSGDADAYGEEMNISTDVTTAVGGKTVRSTYDRAADATAFEALILANGALPADTSIYVTSVGGTTGPAGQACPFVEILWDK